MSTNFYELHAREKASLPDTWKAYRLECFPKGNERTLYIEVTGMVAPAMKTQPERSDFKRGDRATKKTVVLPVADHDAWLARWEQANQKCHKCEGSGQELAGWSVSDGNRYRPCSRCKATGKPPQHS